MTIDTRYYRVADITIEVRSDLPITDRTFHPKFKLFQTDRPIADNIVIHHHFEIDPGIENDPGKKVYERIPWVIYQKNNFWVYRMVSGVKDDYITHSFFVFNNSHTYGDIYWKDHWKQEYLKGHLHSLTGFPSDQVLLARILADRNGCFFHSNGVVFDNKGYLFMGHSGYGKTTISKMLKHRGGTVLCDDRMIVRKYADAIKIHGNWCYGGMPDFSADTIPLKACFFISHALQNSVAREKNKKQIMKQMLSYIVKPLVTSGWWEKNINLMEELIETIPCYTLFFDLSGDIVKQIRQLD